MAHSRESIGTSATAGDTSAIRPNELEQSPYCQNVLTNMFQNIRDNVEETSSQMESLSD